MRYSSSTLVAISPAISRRSPESQYVMLLARLIAAGYRWIGAMVDYRASRSVTAEAAYPQHGSVSADENLIKAVNAVGAGRTLEYGVESWTECR
jgi:hypothetical protein